MSYEFSRKDQKIIAANYFEAVFDGLIVGIEADPKTRPLW